MKDKLKKLKNKLYRRHRPINLPVFQKAWKGIKKEIFGSEYLPDERHLNYNAIYQKNFK